MFKAFILDKILRKFISIIYRTVLIVYSIIILRYNTNVFDWYIYTISISLYVIAIYSLFNKDGFKSKARIIFDYILICLILWGKSLTPGNYLILLVPIFNGPNHSGEKRSIILYVILVLSILILTNGNIHLLDFIPLFIFFIIDALERLRMSILKTSSYLYETIDDFYINHLNLNKSHLIYRELIEKLNSSKFKNLFTIKSILCFTKRENRLVAANGSFFIWTYEISFSEQEYKILEQESILQDKEFVINDFPDKKNFIITATTKGTTYVYVISYLSEGIFFFISFFYVRVLLKPLLHKIAETLYVERQIMIAWRTNIKKVKNKIVYVNNATLAMHFLRNKFSPILGFFDTQELYDKEEDEERREKLNGFMEKNKLKVKNSIKEILQRTNLILEKSENPFIISEFKKLSLKKIFNIARTIWNEYFDSSSIEFNWKTAETSSQFFLLNEEYLEILFTDIIENIHAYNAGIKKLIFDETEDTYSIEFTNNVKEVTDELRKICEYFTSGHTEEINKRTTHGLTMIKSFLLQMKINYELTLNGNTFCLKIVFLNPKNLQP